MQILDEKKELGKRRYKQMGKSDGEVLLYQQEQ